LAIEGNSTARRSSLVIPAKAGIQFLAFDLCILEDKASSALQRVTFCPVTKSHQKTPALFPQVISAKGHPWPCADRALPARDHRRVNWIGVAEAVVG
jgi:hypothetical protein